MFKYLNSDLGPWGLLDELMNSDRRFSRVLEEAARGFSGRYPRVNVYESDDAIVVDAALPGIDPKAVEITVEGSELGLSYGQNEESKGSRFERRFELPFSVDPEKVNAAYRMGVLRITLPKAEEAKRRRIEIKAG